MMIFTIRNCFDNLWQAVFLLTVLFITHGVCISQAGINTNSSLMPSPSASVPAKIMESALGFISSSIIGNPANPSSSSSWGISPTEKLQQLTTSSAQVGQSCSDLFEDIVQACSMSFLDICYEYTTLSNKDCSDGYSSWEVAGFAAVAAGVTIVIFYSAPRIKAKFCSNCQSIEDAESVALKD
jgi:hypothetical protein